METCRHTQRVRVLKILVAVTSLGFVVYLAATGVTLHDCGAWIERHLGINLKKPDMKGVPHPNYSPVVSG